MEPGGSLANVRALTFDVFGTVVDWRSGVAKAAREVGTTHGVSADWGVFADAWRALYQPSLSAVREGRRAWVNLDTLHRESLVGLLGQFGLQALSPSEIDDLAHAWHRLDPWPDAVAGLRRLRERHVLATLSNGNVSLLIGMAKRSDLPWDAILGAEIVRHYKPQPQAYLGTAALLDLEPSRCLMVAAHHSDLVAARECGFRTAFVDRPREFGPRPRDDLPASHGHDLVVADFGELAEALGC